MTDDEKHTADTAAPATEKRFSFIELEPRFDLLKNGLQTLLQMSSGDGIEREAGDAICWIVEMMQEAERELQDLFSKLMEQKRQDWNERDAAMRALEALRADVAAKEVAQA